MSSPYEGHPQEEWYAITEQLVADFPLQPNEIVDAVLAAWDGIMETKVAGKLQIGVDIFPGPQILGNYLHELIPIMLSEKSPGQWSRDVEKTDKDLVYLPNRYYSAEIKTSSSGNSIYGNASYGVEDSAKGGSKSKDGYYIGVNFEKFDKATPEKHPCVNKIRIGWLDHSDWHSQTKSSGQMAFIYADVRDKKLMLIYDKKKGGRLF